MEANAETLFDYLGKRYEDAFADSPDLHEFLELAIRRLPSQSKVLDVGCGTGRPVADTLVSAGHEVCGIDVSQEMINIASAQVAGKFMKADMRTYNPDCLFDGVFVILSLFQITPGETYSMCFRFSEWLKPGGYVVIGVTPSTSLPAGQYTIDPTWDCARQMGKPWMDMYTNETFFSEDGWRKMLQCAGFEVESEVRYSFTPNDPDHKCPEIHYLLLAKKVESQPLLGPYPTINEGQLPAPIRCHSTDRLVSEDLDALLGRLKEEEVLCLGCSNKGLSFLAVVLFLASDTNKPILVVDGAPNMPNMHIFDGPVESLPFPSGKFDAVLALWTLESAVNMEVALGRWRAWQSALLLLGSSSFREHQTMNSFSFSTPLLHCPKSAIKVFSFILPADTWRIRGLVTPLCSGYGHTICSRKKISWKDAK
ncbi:uncharacterized protein GIQ15_02365 [Arthroderma uncinatum]|uniref:uncharacterized protein n=1 Tax=Arthroderma uncinatum TaxID=74035 RepID=UPI00144A7F01|nr:uncharacterized protein GIQ15_02365 [Arthroderma uncinatum]KAF3483041.1 hypothetical protein GIQ15_02365 [Arthroderma uncinatum]